MHKAFGQKDLTLVELKEINLSGFLLDLKGYIGLGHDNNISKYYSDFWEYDILSNTWTQKANFGGGARGGAVGFSINSLGYVGTGTDSNNKRDFWEYNPSTNIWTQKAYFGGSPRSYAIGFSVGNKGYIGTSSILANDDFWEYDPVTDKWTRKSDFAGHFRSGAVGFSIGNKGYVGTGTYTIITPLLPDAHFVKPK